MKTYAGERMIDRTVVTVDGVPLSPRFDLHTFNQTGFEWTYSGPGPQQLALALLADHLSDANKALALSKPFMKAVIAKLDNAWVMTSEDISEALNLLKG
jgi:hypothetical protein